MKKYKKYIKKSLFVGTFEMKQRKLVESKNSHHAGALSDFDKNYLFR